LTATLNLYDSANTDLICQAKVLSYPWNKQTNLYEDLTLQEQNNSIHFTNSTKNPSLNTQSYKRRPLWSTCRFKNVCSPKKQVLFPPKNQIKIPIYYTIVFSKKSLSPKTWKNSLIKLPIIGPQLFFLLARLPKRPRNKNPAPSKARQCRTGYLDWAKNYMRLQAGFSFKKCCCASKAHVYYCMTTSTTSNYNNL